MLILLDALYKFECPKIKTIVTKWFECSKDIKRNNMTLTLKTIILPVSTRQSDEYSCACFVCLYSYIASIFSMNYVTINNWLSYFNYKIKKYNFRKYNIGFKQEFKIYCLLIKMKDSGKDSGKEIIK